MTTKDDDPLAEERDLSKPKPARRRPRARPDDHRPETMSASRALAGKPRVITLVLWRDGERWRGRLKGADAEEQVDEAREAVVRRLQMVAFGRLESAMRHPDAPLVKEVVFKLEEA